MKTTYIIAEIGINHNGDINTAKRLIDIASVAGCDAVKFQKRNPDIAVPDDQKNIKRNTPWGEMTYLAYKNRMEFDERTYDALANHASLRNIDWSASVWDLDSLEFMMQYAIPFIKIPSAKLTDHELVGAVAEYVNKIKVKLVMSTGMSTLQEIDDAVKVVISKMDAQKNLVLMHCNSSYPASIDELNLSCIKTLQERYYCDIGYCVSPDTRILTTDLRWIQAGDIKIGDKLIAFDEELSTKSRTRPAKVISNKPRFLPCYRITTDRGTIVASEDHKFVASSYHKFRKRQRKTKAEGRWDSAWICTKDLTTDMHIRHFVSPWETENDYNAGWLAGMFDGEGWITGRRVCIAQNPGPVLDQIEKLLQERNYKKSIRRQRKDRVCMAIEVGGRRESMRLLGSIRPKRLLTKADMIWNNIRPWSNDSFAKILDIEYVGIQLVSAIKTTTGTLITEGFMSHNSGHEETLGTTVAAVYLGASMIERHITLDRTMWGSDHRSSVTPWGLFKLVNGIRELERAYGTGEKVVYDSELGSRKKLRGY